MEPPSAFKIPAMMLSSVVFPGTRRPHEKGHFSAIGLQVDTTQNVQTRLIGSE
jgi:hypothetical protein